MHIEEAFMFVHTFSPQNLKKKKRINEVIIIYIFTVGDTKNPRIVYSFKVEWLKEQHRQEHSNSQTKKIIKQFFNIIASL